MVLRPEGLGWPSLGAGDGTTRRRPVWRGIPQAEEAKETAVYHAGGIIDGHPTRLDLVFGGTAQRQAGGKEPAGWEAALEVAAFLPAPDDVIEPVNEGAVPVHVLVRADRGQVPEERIARADRPAGIEEPDQRLSRWRLVKPGCLEGGRHLGGGPLDNGVEQRFP